MQERLKTFCPDFFEAPDRYDIDPAQEEKLKSRYRDLQLRETSQLRLSKLCLPTEVDNPDNGTTAQPN
jgi:hypothetical protein